MASHKIENWTAGTLTDEQLRAVTELHFAAFDRKGRTVEQYMDTLRPHWQRGEGEQHDSAQLHVVRDPDQPERLLGKAISFLHSVLEDGKPLPVVALAGVASHPDARGMGVGKAVVLDVFDRVQQGEAPRCLFQTGEARGFYEKLGCKLIDNRFINTTNEEDPQARPWYDTFVMLYPAHTTDWPNGTIDLRRPAW